jgi:hypothetical protein
MNLVGLFQLVDANKFNQFQERVSENRSSINEYLYGATLLFYCIESNKEKFGLELLKYEETDVHLKNNVDLTCLEKAMENRLFDLAKGLLGRYTKADIDRLIEYDGETLLTTSIKTFDENFTLMLLEGNLHFGHCCVSQISYFIFLISF